MRSACLLFAATIIFTTTCQSLPAQVAPKPDRSRLPAAFDALAHPAAASNPFLSPNSAPASSSSWGSKAASPGRRRRRRQGLLLLVRRRRRHPQQRTPSRPRTRPSPPRPTGTPRSTNSPGFAGRPNGSVERYGLHLGPLRRPLHRQKRPARSHLRPLLHRLEETPRRQLGKWLWTPVPRRSRRRRMLRLAQTVSPDFVSLCMTNS